MSTVDIGQTLPSPSVAAEPTAAGVVVETNGLTKRYGEHVAVDGLDFRLESGEIFGLLGPNGAGKTTTILMIMGLTEPTGGTVRVLGHDPAREPLKVKRLVGYLPEHVAMYDNLSARENLLYTADLNGLRGKTARARVDWTLERMGLADVADKSVSHFSHGMRQRLGIADVLVKQPKMIVLDEPTLGLDPEAVNGLLDLIVEMSREEGISVLLCSHQLQQVQRICNRVGILVRGKMIADGPIERLAEQLAGGTRTLEVLAAPDGPEVGALLRDVAGVRNVEREEGYWVVRSAGDLRGAIARAVVQRDLALLHLRERDYGLEEIYLRYFREG